MSSGVVPGANEAKANIAGDALIGRVKITDGTTVALVNAANAALQVYIKGSDVASGGTSATDGGAYTAASTTGTPIMGARDDSSPGAVAEDKLGIVRISTRREMYVQLRDAAGNERGLNIDANNALAVTVATIPSHAVTNAGTFVVQENGTQVIADDAAFTPATTKLVMAGFEADETATDSVDEGDAGAGRITLDRKQIVTLYPHTAGGLSTAMFSGSDGSTALTNSAQAVKASAGQLYGYWFYNPSAAISYVHFYNTASGSVTVGTTNPQFTLSVPTLQSGHVTFPYGVAFTNAGWSVAATTTAGGNSAPATAMDLVVWYI